MSSGEVTQLYIASLADVRACDSAHITWGYEGKATDEDVSILRLYTATRDDPEYHTITMNVGTDIRYYSWGSVNAPPGMYTLFIRDDDSLQNATSNVFELLPPSKPASCYKNSDITHPIPGPRSGSTSSAAAAAAASGNSNAVADEAAPKSQTIVPSVVVPVVVLLVLALIVVALWRRRHRGGEGHTWARLRSRLPAAGAVGAAKERRWRRKEKVSVALPSAPRSAAARQTSARQLNETDLGPYGFVSEEYPMSDRQHPHRRSKPSSFRAPRAAEGSRKDFMLYDSGASEGEYDDYDADEDLKLMPLDTPTEGRILPAYHASEPGYSRDEEEAGMLGGGDTGAGSAESRAHLFTRRGYGDVDGYVQHGFAEQLPRSSFALRPPSSAVTRTHHHEAHTGAAPSAQPRTRRR